MTETQLTVRRADPTDVNAILDLLTHYDKPREFFEPWYAQDPAYRPEDSWVVEEAGQLAAHLRVYPRQLRLGPAATLSVAGIGNVVTARQARGRGLADRLLQAAVAASADEGYAYSLLWTHIPGLYARQGYGLVPEEKIRATVTSAVSPGVRPGRAGDLTSVAALQARFDALRFGPALRDAEFWTRSSAWLHDDIVVSEDGGGIGGYVRYRTDTEWVSVLELGVANNDQRTAAGLLTAAAAPRQGRLEARLPPSLRPLLAPWDAVELDAPGLMGRPLSLDALSRTLTRVWSPQLAFGRAGPAEVIVPFSVNDVVSEVKVTPQSVSQAQPSAEGDHLDAGQFTALLLRGCDSRTRQLLAGRADVGQLALIAPAHDFVLWPTDSF